MIGPKSGRSARAQPLVQRCRIVGHSHRAKTINEGNGFDRRHLRLASPVGIGNAVRAVVAGCAIGRSSDNAVKPPASRASSCAVEAHRIPCIASRKSAGLPGLAPQIHAAPNHSRGALRGTWSRDAGAIMGSQAPLKTFSRAIRASMHRLRDRIPVRLFAVLWYFSVREICRHDGAACPRFPQAEPASDGIVGPGPPTQHDIAAVPDAIADRSGDRPAGARIGRLSHRREGFPAGGQAAGRRDCVDRGRTALPAISRSPSHMPELAQARGDAEATLSRWQRCATCTGHGRCRIIPGLMFLGRASLAGMTKPRRCWPGGAECPEHAGLGARYAWSAVLRQDRAGDHSALRRRAPTLSRAARRPFALAGELARSRQL